MGFRYSKTRRASMRALGLCLGLIVAGLSLPVHADSPAPKAAESIVAPYQAVADRIVNEMLAKPRAYDKLVTLCDRHGHRLSGSPSLEAAIDWAIATMKHDGADDARREEVMVPRWVRGNESAEMLTPRAQPLFMLGIGGSVGTPAEGISAEVVTVIDEEELKALGDAVKDKIVLFNNPMPQWTVEEGTCYGKTVRFRVHGARLASEQGARAVLIRSVTARSLRSPHTGTLSYGDAKVKIPSAALATEDADMIARMQARGHQVTVRLKMEARMEPPAKSANAVAELRGHEKPEEIVIISGHIDSWDVGQGAHDDGSGVVMAMETLATLKRMNLRPRRTIRVVLWTNEENGMAGAKSYLKRHADALPNHIAAFEADFGGFAPTSIGVASADPKVQAIAAEQIRAILSLLPDRVGRMTVKPGSSAPDVYRFKNHGVPAMGLYTHGEHYFDYHHTEADTVDKVDPMELSRSAAAMAVVAYVLADMPGRLGRLAQDQDSPPAEAGEAPPRGQCEPPKINYKPVE